MRAIDIAFSCYPVKSIKRAQAFYEGAMNLKATSTWVKDDENGMIEYDIGPATLAIGAGADSFKIGEGGAAVAIEVENFDEAMNTLKGKKATFLVEPMETPVCHMAIVEDPDGNKIMIHKRKPK